MPFLVSKGQRDHEEAVNWDAQCHLRASVVYPHKRQHVSYVAAMRTQMSYISFSQGQLWKFCCVKH